MDEYKVIMLSGDDNLTVKLDGTSVVGTDDYNTLINIPKINNVEVKGEKALEDYDIESASEAKKEFENLNSKINIHVSDADIHVSRTDRMKWNSGTTYSIATHTANGLMSAADKTRLDNLATESVSSITNAEIDTIIMS